MPKPFNNESDAGRRAFEIVRDLAPLNRHFCSPDTERAISYLQELLPFDVHTYPAADEHNGWVIPPRWQVTRASISEAGTGRIVWDGTAHPLAVISFSTSFRGRVPVEDLKRHLYYDHRFDDAIPYHFRQKYRSWSRDWGFCVPKTLYDALDAEEYDVVIEVDEGPGELKVVEHVHHGSTADSIAFVAHLDHPGMANDDLAGCAVGVEVFRRLAQQNTKFTYRLLLDQEIIGSVYWWARTNAGNAARVFESVFLEMLGSTTPLALQASLNGNSETESAVGAALEASGVEFRRGDFGTIVVNDEYVWESYGVPMASLSRFPYPEYHSDRDNLTIISESALGAAVEVVLDAIDRLEKTTFVRKTFSGTLCLSNPRFDLYVDGGQRAFGDVAGEDIRRLRHLQDLIPTLNGLTSIRALARRTGVDESAALDYLRRWEAKGLVEIL